MAKTDITARELIDKVKRGEEALKSQLIPIHKELWSIEKYRDFLGYRRQAIADEINQFMSKFLGENKNA